MIHSQRYVFWKKCGVEDTEKKQWNEGLAQYEYNDGTKDCICGYLQGVGSHDPKWMIEKYKEIIPKNADCIRFISLSSDVELNDVIEFIANKKLDLFGNLSVLHLIESFISTANCGCFNLSESNLLFIINLLPDIVDDPQQLSYLRVAEYVFRNLVPQVLESRRIKESMYNIYEIMWRNQTELLYPELVSIREALCKLFINRFPDFKDRTNEEITVFKDKFFQINLKWFVSNYSSEISSFEEKFPYLYKVFLKPLLDDQNFHNLSLYLFFCERLFYRPIFSELHAIKLSQTQFAKHLEFLEEFFQKTLSNLDENNRQVFVRKIETLRRSFNTSNLPTIADESWGIYGEIKCLQEVINRAKMVANNEIDIPHKHEKDDEKICDVRLYDKSKCSYDVFEGKCKTPGYGYDGGESLLNDYLLNYIPLFSDFISMFIPEVNILSIFPNFAFENQRHYGSKSVYIDFIYKKAFQVKYSYNELRDSNVEKTIIENIFYCFYNLGFFISAFEQLPSNKETMIVVKKEEAKLLLGKSFLQSTLQKALRQFLAEQKRAAESGLVVNKFVLCWTLNIPQDLISSPFFLEINSNSELRKNIETQICEILGQLLDSTEFLPLKDQKVEIVFL